MAGPIPSATERGARFCPRQNVACKTPRVFGDSASRPFPLVDFIVFGVFAPEWFLAWSSLSRCGCVCPGLLKADSALHFPCVPRSPPGP